MKSAESTKNAANRYNERLAERVRRWRRTRLILMGVLVMPAVTVYLATYSIILSLPFVAGAGIVLFFWLDANDRLREIRKGNWQRLTPSCAASGSPGHPASKTPGAAGQPSPV